MTILQALNKFYARLDRRGDAPKRGYMPVRIGFVLEISADGTPGRLIDIRDKSKKTAISEKFLMPGISRTSGIKSAFMWDKTAYVFGVAGIEETIDGKKAILPGQKKRTLQEHQAFVELHEERLGKIDDEGASALLAFLQNWAPENWDQSGFNNEALDQNIAFRLKGDDDRIDQRAAVMQVVGNLQGQQGESAMCLIEGTNAAFVENHPQFKGVIGAQSSGAPIVSFNSDAYESFGKSRGANAPVSQQAAFRYGAALNWLLDRDNGRCLRMGEATVVFWADEKDVGEDAANNAEEFFDAPFGSNTKEPDPVATDPDKNQAEIIKTELANAASGRAAPDEAELKPETRMHILALSPNAGRIAVRFWLTDTFGHLRENLLQHERDLALEPSAFKGKPKAWALLYETAAQHKEKNIPSRLGGEMMQAILTGQRYPRTFLTAVIGRIRADKNLSGVRAAILKATINRDLRKNERDETKEGIPMALAENSSNQAYNLGRLFAAYEYAEKSVAKRNATIKDKFIGSASATPQRIFPIIMRGYEHNVSKLAKGSDHQRGSGVRVAQVVSQILGLFEGDADFPTALKLEDQARFFVGYYHQNAAMYAKKPDADGKESSNDQT